MSFFKDLYKSKHENTVLTTRIYAFLREEDVFLSLNGRSFVRFLRKMQKTGFLARKEAFFKLV